MVGSHEGVLSRAEEVIGSEVLFIKVTLAAKCREDRRGEAGGRHLREEGRSMGWRGRVASKTFGRWSLEASVCCLHILRGQVLGRAVRTWKPNGTGCRPGEESRVTPEFQLGRRANGSPAPSPYSGFLRI